MNCPIHKAGFEDKESTRVTSRGEGYFFFFFFRGRLGPLLQTEMKKITVKGDLGDGKSTGN